VTYLGCATSSVGTLTIEGFADVGEMRDHRRHTGNVSSSNWLNYSQAMQFLDVSRSTLDVWRKSGHINFSKLPNGQLRIRREVLEEWLESLVEV
jgi:excisionase family DNA binding protein